MSHTIPQRNLTNATVAAPDMHADSAPPSPIRTTPDTPPAHASPAGQNTSVAHRGYSAINAPIPPPTKSQQASPASALLPQSPAWSQSNPRPSPSALQSPGKYPRRDSPRGRSTEDPMFYDDHPCLLLPIRWSNGQVVRAKRPAAIKRPALLYAKIDPACIIGPFPWERNGTSVHRSPPLPSARPWCVGTPPRHPGISHSLRHRTSAPRHSRPLKRKTHDP
jgi:hypothetical protein